MGGGASGTAAGGGGAGDAGAGAAGGGVAGAGAGAGGVAAGAAVAGGAALSGGSGSAAHAELGANSVLRSVSENATTLVSENATTLVSENATTLDRANVEAMAGVLFTRCYSVVRRGTKRDTMNGSTPGGPFNRFGQRISSDPKVSYLFGARL